MDPDVEDDLFLLRSSRSSGAARIGGLVNGTVYRKCVLSVGVRFYFVCSFGMFMCVYMRACVPAFVCVWKLCVRAFVYVSACVYACVRVACVRAGRWVWACVCVGGG